MGRCRPRNGPLTRAYPRRERALADKARPFRYAPVAVGASIRKTLSAAPFENPTNTMAVWHAAVPAMSNRDA